jgi:hypothetical protein
MSVTLRKVKSIPFLMKKKKVTENLETFIQRYEPPSSDHYQDLDFLRRLRLAERIVDHLLLLHEQHDEPRRDGEVWYWGNDVNREFPMKY